MKKDLPILILQNLVLLPYEEVKLELNNDLSKRIVDVSSEEFENTVLIVSPKNQLEVRPSVKDLPSIATFTEIKNKLVLPSGNVRVTIRGKKRVEIDKYVTDSSLVKALWNSISNPEYNLEEEQAYIRKIDSSLKEYVSLSDAMSNTIIGVTKNVSNLSKLTDLIGASIDLNYKDKWYLYNEADYFKRAKKILELLTGGIELLKFDMKIEEEVRSKFKRDEKELFIKAKIDALSQELGKTVGVESDCERILSKIEKLNVNSKIKDNMKREVTRLSLTSEASPEYSVIRTHLEFLTALPWNKESKLKKDIKEIDKEINETHYGLAQAKNRIEEYIALKSRNKALHSPILCLVGPPGTGKTTFARELAKSVGREFVKISVGGLNDSSELVGHRRTYIGAGPGKIMESIRRCGVNNPIILIDEVDKMVKDYKGDPASVLLDILDENMNCEFVDNYVGEPFNLGNVLFILTANDVATIPNPLLDRLEVINVHSYTLFDKIEIAKHYTLPRLASEYDFDYTKISLSDKVIAKIVDEYTKEAGVRELERQIAAIMRNVMLKNSTKKIVITEKDLPKYLGPKKYSNYLNEYSKCGSVNVPAVKGVQGCILNIECALYDGDSKIIATGSLGDVLKESIEVAIGYIKSNAKKLKCDVKKLNGVVHVHILDGASKKDGPSAGLAITTALISSVLGIKVPNDVAFTGEISLEGRILRVGGLKEKLISSYNSGIRKVFIPTENIEELENIPKVVLDKVNVVPVNTFMEVYEDLFD